MEGNKFDSVILSKLVYCGVLRIKMILNRCIYYFWVDINIAAQHVNATIFEIQFKIIRKGETSKSWLQYLVYCIEGVQPVLLFCQRAWGGVWKSFTHRRFLLKCVILMPLNVSPVFMATC